jgi:hypothetical protein
MPEKGMTGRWPQYHWPDVFTEYNLLAVFAIKEKNKINFWLSPAYPL